MSNFTPMSGPSKSSHHLSSLIGRLLYLILAFSLCMVGCEEGRAPSELDSFERWVTQSDAPPPTTPEDLLKRQKADVIVLPSVSIAVWAIGVLVAYVGTHIVYHSDVGEFSSILGDAFTSSDDWDWVDWETESDLQASHMSASLERVAYRSPDSDFYAYTGNDYLHFLNLANHARILDPGELKEMLDGKIRPFGRYAKEYFNALRKASVRARYQQENPDGLCVISKVHSIPDKTPYYGLAKATNHIDVIPAAILASIKATTRCGMYNENIRDFVYGFFSVDDVRGTLVDIFLSHGMRSARLLYDYVDVCQLPPSIEVKSDRATCEDPQLTSTEMTFTP